MKFFQSLYNSAVITIASVFLIVVLGGLAAYPITRFDNRLTRFLSVYFLTDSLRNFIFMTILYLYRNNSPFLPSCNFKRVWYNVHIFDFIIFFEHIIFI